MTTNDYTNFLERANNTPEKVNNFSQVPQLSSLADTIISSEADEPLEPVSLPNFNITDQAAFGRMVGHDVEKGDLEYWNLHYPHVIKAVEAVVGTVYIYTSTSHTRIRHWIVGRDGEQVVGVMATMIES